MCAVFGWRCHEYDRTSFVVAGALDTGEVREKMGGILPIEEKKNTVVLCIIDCCNYIDHRRG